MNGDLLATIHCNSNSFTRVERLIADYVLAHRDRVPLMSISELALNCGVSDSTVYRFCRRLGLDGYRDFCMGLAASAQGPSADLAEDKLSERVYARHLSCLSETYHLLDMGQMQEAAQHLLHARHVLLVGSNLSLLSVVYRHLMEITPCIAYSQSERAQKYYAQTLTHGDMVIAFSHQGSADETVSMVKNAKKNGACVLAFTHFFRSPLSALADYAIFSAEVPAAPGQSASLLGTYTFLAELLCAVCSNLRSGESSGGI